MFSSDRDCTNERIGTHSAHDYLKTSIHSLKRKKKSIIDKLEMQNILNWV